MKNPIMIIGAGGHARVLIDTLLNSGCTILGMTDPKPEKAGTSIFGIAVLGNDEILRNYPPESVDLVNGIGATHSTDQRKRIYQLFKRRGYRFVSVLHPSAVIGTQVQLAEGVQVMAGAIIQPCSIIGDNTIVNTRAAVDHDCRIGAHVHLAPGSTLSGGVEIGEGAFIGSSATIIQNIRVGDLSFIAAGAIVVNNIPEKKIAMGIPARIRKK